MPNRPPAIPVSLRYLGEGIREAYRHLGLSAGISLLWFVCHLPFYLALALALANASAAVPEKGSYAYVAKIEGITHLYLGKQDGSGEREIQTGQAGRIGDPAISRDGSKVACVIEGRILALAADGDWREWLSGPIRYAQPAFSPDGRELAFTGYAEDASSRIFRGTPGEAVSPVTGGPADSDPCWSPNGRQIALVRREEGGSTAIYLKTLADGSEKRLTAPATPGTAYARPIFSPDGGEIAYLLREGKSVEVCLTTLRDRKTRQVTRNQLTESDLYFNAAGTRIFFTVVPPGGPARVYSVKLTGGVEQRLRPGQPSAAVPWLWIAGLVWLSGALLAGPANAAVLHAARRALEDESKVKEFFSGFRRYFWRAVGVYGSYLALLALLIANFVAGVRLGGLLSKFSLFLTAFAGIVAVLSANYFFPLLVLQRNKWSIVWKKAMQIAAGNGFMTFAGTILTALFYLLSLFFGIILALFFPAAVAFGQYRLFESLIAKYEAGGGPEGGPVSG